MNYASRVNVFFFMSKKYFFHSMYFFFFVASIFLTRFNAFQCFLVDFLSKLNKFCIGESIPAAFPSPLTLSLYSPELCKLQCSGKKLLNDGNKNSVKCFVSYLHTGSAKICISPWQEAVRV